MCNIPDIIQYWGNAYIEITWKFPPIISHWNPWYDEVFNQWLTWELYCTLKWTRSISAAEAISETTKHTKSCILSVEEKGAWPVLGYKLTTYHFWCASQTKLSNSFLYPTFTLILFLYQFSINEIKAGAERKKINAVFCKKIVCQAAFSNYPVILQTKKIDRWNKKPFWLQYQWHCTTLYTYLGPLIGSERTTLKHKINKRLHPSGNRSAQTTTLFPLYI